MLKPVLSSVINYVLPYRCASCSELTKEQDGVCAECFQKLNFITSPYCKICGFPFEFVIEEQFSCGKCIAMPPKYDLARSLFKFDQQSKNLIYAFKYNDQTNHAKMFAKLLLARYKQDIGDIDIIVPVPMYHLKRLIRNYNPAQILAKEISRFLGKIILPNLLIKTKWTKPQTSLSKSERLRNLAGSIIVNDRFCIKGKNILLVDDVKTTGTTGNNCSMMLKKAGAKNITLVTIGMA